jgi:hypothetical protein
MKTRLAPGLAALVALVMTFAPAATLAQSEAPAQAEASSEAEVSAPPLQVDHELIERLCAAAAADDAQLASCVESVGAALTAMAAGLSEEERTLLGQAADLVDQSLEDLRRVDVEAILADAVQDLQAIDIELDLDVERALEDAFSALDDLGADGLALDAQRAIEDAVGDALAAAEDLDLGAAIEGALDEALTDVQAAFDEAGLQRSIDEVVVGLEERVAQAQAVVAEAQAWARENRDALCRGGSIGLGTTVGLAVLALTGVEWLGLQAFWATERFTNTTCGDVVGG